MTKSRQDLRKKRKKKSWLKRILFIVIILFLIVFGIGAYVFYQAYDAAKESFVGLERGGKSDLRKEEVTIGKDPISILLLGVEDYSTGGKNGHADTDIVVTLNPDSHKMTMVSIPRDTMVEFNDGKQPQFNGKHKLTEVYHFSDMLGNDPNLDQIRAVEGLLKIPIDNFIKVDFQGFTGVVDALGGVDVDIKKGFWEKDIFNDDKRINFEAGPAHLGGEEALAFVRMRKRAVNASYSRDERQRQFIRAALNQAISAKTIFKVDEISDILGEHVETNMKPKEIYALEKAYSSMEPGSIETLKIKGNDQRVNGKYFFLPDEEGLNEVSQKLKRSLGLNHSAEGESSTGEGSLESTTESNTGG